MFLIHQEDTTVFKKKFINLAMKFKVTEPQNIQSQKQKHMSTRGMGISTVTVGFFFNTSISVIDWQSRPDVSEPVEDLNSNLVKWVDFMDRYAAYPTREEYINSQGQAEECQKVIL